MRPASLLLAAACISCHSGVTQVAKQVPVAPDPAKEATWSWPKTPEQNVQKGVTKWLLTAEDGTTLDLIRFDFQENPKLTFRMYDQDEDDDKPFDNLSDYFPRGVGQIVQGLNQKSDDKVVAAWNGLFFGYDQKAGSSGRMGANHIGPVVLRGKAYHNVGRHRWSFGVKTGDGFPKFKALFKPSIPILQSEFDYAADGAQLLVNEGHPLHIQPFQDSITGHRPEDTPADAGPYPLVDWMKTSRTSMAWSKDGRYFWLLVVAESDHEVGSKLAAKYGREDHGGWTLEDLQTFWLKLGAWGAVNSDGGIVTQLAWRTKANEYEILPSRQSGVRDRLRTSDLSKSPGGGSLLTFYIAETP